MRKCVKWRDGVLQGVWDVLSGAKGVCYNRRRARRCVRRCSEGM